MAGDVHSAAASATPDRAPLTESTASAKAFSSFLDVAPSLVWKLVLDGGADVKASTLVDAKKRAHEDLRFIFD